MATKALFRAEPDLLADRPQHPLTQRKYTLVDFYGTYAVTPTWSVTGRVANAFNKAYAQWVDVNYPTQVQLGSPVTYEISVAAKF